MSLRVEPETTYGSAMCLFSVLWPNVCAGVIPGAGTMSLWGHKRTSEFSSSMSGFGDKADVPFPRKAPTSQLGFGLNHTPAQGCVKVPAWDSSRATN